MKAMILAAGKGERMRPLTLSCPKPLLRAGGKPLIDYHIENLRAAGFSELVINHAWLGEQLETYLGDGSGHGVRISWSPEGEPLETAGGIRQALPQLYSDEGWFVVVNGDIWCDFDFSQLKPPTSGLAKLVMTANPAHNPGGDFHLDEEGRIHSDGPDRLTFTGISLLHPDLFSGTFGAESKLAPILRRAAQAGCVSGTRHHGSWFDIGTPERLQQLDALLIRANKG